jgi:hypothetical protein
MTLYEFLMLDEMDQIEAFWNGVPVGTRSEGAFVIECRQVNGFYLEYRLLGVITLICVALKSRTYFSPICIKLIFQTLAVSEYKAAREIFFVKNCSSPAEASSTTSTTKILHAAIVPDMRDKWLTSVTSYDSL